MIDDGSISIVIFGRRCLFGGCIVVNAVTTRGITSKVFIFGAHLAEVLFLHLAEDHCCSGTEVCVPLVTMIFRFAALGVGTLVVLSSEALVPIVQKPWIRLTEKSTEAVLETCTRSYANGEQKVDLVGVVHVGEAEYFTELASGRGKVLYESIVNEEAKVNETLRYAIAATPAARMAAAQCGLVAQSDILGKVAFDRRWRIADVTTTEFEAIPKKKAKRRRLDEVVGVSVARMLCALAPAPELSLALLDWSRRSKTDALVDVTAVRAVLAGGDLQKTLSSLALARDLVGVVDTDLENRDDAPIVLKRNDFIIKALTNVDAKTIRIVYGALHMRDLEWRLRGLGFSLVQGSDHWSRAFAIPLAAPPQPTGGFVPKAILLFFLALLAADGVDYVSLAAVGFPGGSPDLKLLDLGLYALRHAALYYALTKFIVA